jgi:hypothetical protein
MDRVTIIQIIEVLLLPLLVLGLNWIRDRSRAKQDQDGVVFQKKTLDETDYTKLLVEQNTARHDQIRQDLIDARNKLDEALAHLHETRIENLHLRHLLGLGPDSPLPHSKEEMIRRHNDDSDPLHLPNG